MHHARIWGGAGGGRGDCKVYVHVSSRFMSDCICALSNVERKKLSLNDFVQKVIKGIHTGTTCLISVLYSSLHLQFT